MAKNQKSPRPKSFAARFREVFEAELARVETGQEENKEAPGLAHHGKGRPVIIDRNGEKKYVYSDGTIDQGSIVSPEVETRAFEIGSIATRAEQKTESITEPDMAQIGAVSLYGLHGQDLDEFLAGAEAPDTPSPMTPSRQQIAPSEQVEAQAA